MSRQISNFIDSQKRECRSLPRPQNESETPFRSSPREMSNLQDTTTLQEDARYLRENMSNLNERASSLPEAVQQDLQPKIDRIETMVSALERDAVEAGKSAGASQETARELRNVIELELSRLDQETENLSIGAPTTITAALDAIFHTIESAEEKLKKFTGRVKLPQS